MAPMANGVGLPRECAARGWSLVTCDDRIRYVPENKAAVLEYKLRAFMFCKGNYQGVEYAAALIIGRVAMGKIIRTVAPPFIVRHPTEMVMFSERAAVRETGLMFPIVPYNRVTSSTCSNRSDRSFTSLAGEEAKMTTRRVVTSALALITAVFAVAVFAVRGMAQEPRTGTGGIYDQFAITLPDGWSVYDQNEALSGKPSSVGVVFFSAQPVTKEGSAAADAALLAKVDTGETPSFFVDRSKASKGMTCAKLSKGDIYGIGTTINQDPAIATVGRRLFSGALEPKHTDIDVGGCHGVRFQLEAHKDDAAKHWKVDARAVSDGKTLYIFSVRHRGGYYDDSLGAFEKAMSTLRFKLAN